MPVVRIPTVLRKHTAGAAKVEASGATVREVFDQLVSSHPDLQENLLDDGEVRGFINVYVDDEDIRYISGIDTPVADDSEIAIMPAVAGGAGGAERSEHARRMSTAGGAERSEHARRNSAPGGTR